MRRLSSVFGKKVWDFIKKESESLVLVGLKIPRDYQNAKEGKKEDIPLSLSKSLFESKEFDGFESVSGVPRYETYNNSYQKKLYLNYYSKMYQRKVF